MTKNVSAEKINRNLLKTKKQQSFFFNLPGDFSRFVAINIITEKSKSIQIFSSNRFTSSDSYLNWPWASFFNSVKSILTSKTTRHVSIVLFIFNCNARRKRKLNQQGDECLLSRKKEKSIRRHVSVWWRRKKLCFFSNSLHKFIGFVSVLKRKEKKKTKSSCRMKKNFSTLFDLILSVCINDV